MRRRAGPLPRKVGDEARRLGGGRRLLEQLVEQQALELEGGVLVDAVRGEESPDALEREQGVAAEFEEVAGLGVDEAGLDLDRKSVV